MKNLSNFPYLGSFPYYSKRRILTQENKSQGIIYSILTKDLKLREVVLYNGGGASIILTDTQEEHRVYSKAFIDILTGKGEYKCTEEQFSEAQQEALNRILKQNGMK